MKYITYLGYILIGYITFIWVGISNIKENYNYMF